MRKWETADLSVVRNHRIAASKGVSEHKAKSMIVLSVRLNH